MTAPPRVGCVVWSHICIMISYTSNNAQTRLSTSENMLSIVQIPSMTLKNEDLLTNIFLYYFTENRDILRFITRLENRNNSCFFKGGRD